MRAVASKGGIDRRRGIRHRTEREGALRGNSGTAQPSSQRLRRPDATTEHSRIASIQR